jgi:ribosomal protein L35
LLAKHSSSKSSKPTETFRQFNCANCNALVSICPQCDRGNTYCSNECAAHKRLESKRAAAKRYRETENGRVKNRERQRAFRKRWLGVTHQGSKPNEIDSHLQPQVVLGAIEAKSVEETTDAPPLKTPQAQHNSYLKAPHEWWLPLRNRAVRCCRCGIEAKNPSVRAYTINKYKKTMGKK